VLGEVEDREPSVAEADAGSFVDPRTGAVGAAVVDPVRHRREDRLRLLWRTRATRIEDADDATHQIAPRLGTTPLISPDLSSR
jgi:hypothetical protein